MESQYSSTPVLQYSRPVPLYSSTPVLQDAMTQHPTSADQRGPEHTGADWGAGPDPLPQRAPVRQHSSTGPALPNSETQQRAFSDLKS